MFSGKNFIVAMMTHDFTKIQRTRFFFLSVNSSRMWLFVVLLFISFAAARIMCMCMLPNLKHDKNLNAAPHNLNQTSEERKNGRKQLAKRFFFTFCKLYTCDVILLFRIH